MILKIIGIIILVILGVLLIGIVLILFCPFRYSVNGSIPGNGEDVTRDDYSLISALKHSKGYGRISYLGGLITFNMNSDDVNGGILRIAFIKKYISFSDDEEEDNKNKKTEKTKESVKDAKDSEKEEGEATDNKALLFLGGVGTFFKTIKEEKYKSGEWKRPKSKA